jgi:hypothetical protein
MVHNKGMTIEECVARLEARLGKDDPLVVQLRDAATATALMEARQSLALREHAEWLVEYDKAIVESRREAEASKREWEASKREWAASRREWDQRIKDLDKRITDLVSGFGAYLSRQQ